LFPIDTIIDFKSVGQCAVNFGKNGFSVARFLFSQSLQFRTSRGRRLPGLFLCQGSKPLSPLFFPECLLGSRLLLHDITIISSNTPILVKAFVPDLYPVSRHH